MMDFSKCQCQQAGFCTLFNKIMTSDPPNWQWCQNATASERERYKICSDNGKKTIQQKNDIHVGKMVSNSDLINDAVHVLLPKVMSECKISGIVGIPRSGMIPASVMSTALSVPLFSINEDKIIILNSSSSSGGYRMKHYNENEGQLLIVDDTVHGGHVARKIKERFPETKMAAVYVVPENKHAVDFYAKELQVPHLLEWNFFNSYYAQESLFDIDGIFSPNVPVDICQDESKYVEYISNVIPFFDRIPKLFKAKALVTGRLERYREITEQWLKKHEFNYKELIMFPTEFELRRNRNHIAEVGQYKAAVMRRLTPRFFVESEISEAEVIRKLCNFGTIICPNEKVYF